jgi:PAS domain S-box-containing protein
MALRRKSFWVRFFSFNSFQARLRASLWSLGLFFGLTLASLLIVSWLYQRFTYQNVQVYKPTELYSRQMSQAIQQVQTLLQKAIYTQPKDESDRVAAVQVRKIWKNDIFPLADSLRRLSKKYQDEEVNETYIDLRNRLNKLYKSTQNAANLIYEPKENFVPTDPSGDTTQRAKVIYYNAKLEIFLGQTRWQIQQTDINNLLDNLIEKSRVEAATKGFELNQRLLFLLIIGCSLFIISLLALVVSAYVLRNNLKNDWLAFQKFWLVLLKGNIPPKIKIRSQELQTLANSFNQFINYLTDLQQFALRVGKRQFDNQNKLFNDQGELGTALAQMRDGLQELFDENAVRYWANKGIADFSEIITRHSNNMPRLADEVVSGLVNYLGINQGGFFIKEMDKNGKFYLELKSAFAYDKKKYLEKRINLGQGLVGQVWQEGELTYLREVPETYVEITSGLGGAVPRALLLVPLRVGAEVHGVIELGSFNDLPQYKIDFVEKIAENVGQAIASSRTNEQTKKLLWESQELTQTLQAQDEQMRQNMEELQQTQFMMSITQRELAEKEANLNALINNTSHAILAFTKNYRLMVVNRAMHEFYASMNIQLEIGKNLLEELPEAEFSANRKEYEKALLGEKSIATREYILNGQNHFYELSYNPIKNDREQVIGASIFMENITQQKQAENQLKETQANLSSLINDTEDLIYALDKQGNIIVANEVCIAEFAKNGINLALEKPILEYLPENTRSNWQKLYNRALQGERFVKVITTATATEKLYREYWFNPIRDEADHITGISVFSRDVTEAKNAEHKIRQVLLESLEATENLKLRETEMQQKIAEYEAKIKDLEEKTKANMLN